MGLSEYEAYTGLDEIGKEYIGKCVRITYVTNTFIQQIADSIFVIKSTLNLIKPELEEVTKDEKKQKEVNAYIGVIKDKTTQILRISRETKIKLLKISNIKFSSKTDEDTKEKHTITYKNFHATMLGLVENFLRDIVEQLYDALKEYHRLISSNASYENLLKWHAVLFRDLKESLRFLKIAVSNNNVITNHIEEYRKNLINQIKTYQILDEAKKIRPISLMRTHGRVKVDDLTIGDIFGHSLYTEDSTLVKEAYDPFSAQDITELKGKNIQKLYKHNNLDKHLNPSDYHIAVVDDDKAFTNLIGEQLRDLQFKVDIYNNGEKALKDISTTIPDLILLDIRMPSINGIAFLKALYNQEDEKVKIKIPVIMTTALVNEKLIRECLNLGAFDYIVKPISIDDLLVKITSYLHLKQH